MSHDGSPVVRGLLEAQTRRACVPSLALVGQLRNHMQFSHQCQPHPIHRPQTLLLGNMGSSQARHAQAPQALLDTLQQYFFKKSGY